MAGMKKISLILVIVLLLTGIAILSTREFDRSENLRLLKVLYSNSNDTISIDTSDYFLETYLFMNQKKHNIIALIYLVDAKTLQIYSNTTITGIYVINDKTVWSSIPLERNIPDFKQVETSSNGPKWDTEIYVDVVAELMIHATKNKYILIARHQYFEALNK
jgi:hypothetical protein